MHEQSPRRVSRAALVRARDFICDHLDEPISLDALAHEAGVSRFVFLRRFAGTFGMTPHAYIVHQRMARAQELLVRDDRSVTDVCFDVGFSSVGSFSTLFTRRFGDSPLRFRQRSRQLVLVPGWVVDRRVPLCFMARTAF